MSKVSREMVASKVKQSKKSKRTPRRQRNLLVLLYDYYTSAMIAPHYGVVRLACWCVGLVHWS